MRHKPKPLSPISVEATLLRIQKGNVAQESKIQLTNRTSKNRFTVVRAISDTILPAVLNYSHVPISITR